MRSINFKPIKSVVYGLGGHGFDSHIEHFRHGGIELFGAYDPKQVHMGDSFEHYAVTDNWYSSESAAFDDVNVEAIFIMTPDATHLSLAEQAIAAGKHVFVEKPIITSDLDSERLIKLISDAREHDLVLSTCHPRRLDRPYMLIASMLPQWIGNFGAVKYLELRFEYHKPTKVGIHDGLLIDHLPHEIDTMHHFLGESDFNILASKDSQVSYFAAGDRADGVNFNFYGERNLDEHIFREIVVIDFEQGKVKVDMHDASMSINGGISHDIEILLDGDVFKTDYDGRFISVNRNFAESIRLGKAPYLTDSNLLVNNIVPAKLNDMIRNDNFEKPYAELKWFF